MMMRRRRHRVPRRRRRRSTVLRRRGGVAAAATALHRRRVGRRHRGEVVEVAAVGGIWAPRSMVRTHIEGLEEIENDNLIGGTWDRREQTTYKENWAGCYHTICPDLTTTLALQAMPSKHL